jgi:hypothetical protein
MKNIKILAGVIVVLLTGSASCKKADTSASTDTGITTTITPPPTTIVTGTDPAIAATQGFFLDNWQPKTFTLPSSTVSVTKPSSSGSVLINVDLSQIVTKVSKLIFGNNTNPYMGQYVTDAVLMNNLTGLAPNILRAPGGSISDVYFWNADGSKAQKPADVPDSLMNLSGVTGAVIIRRLTQ